MPSDLLAAARVFQIPGPASPEPGPASSSPPGAARRAAGHAVPVPAIRALGSVLPEGTLRPEEDRPEVTLPAGLDSLTGPDGPLDPSSPGTLLAVVPIPGTDSSLAIVGYTVPASAPRDLVQASRRTGRGLVVDHARRCVWLSGQEIQLTYQEFELLAFLSANPAQVFSRADLLERVWGQRENSHHHTRTVDVHVSRLRRKLGPAFGQCLTTEHRVGYRFDPALEISA
jgi:DNA-binding winged helix-turn-helix (wHTH) protein